MSAPDFKSGCVVSRAADSDFKRIALLEKNNSASPYSEQLLQEMFSGTAVFFKAEEDGQIAGYACIEIVFEDADLINIVVDSSFRGRGIGISLLGEAVRHSFDCGATRVLLEVDENNHAAINLYKKFGFLQIAKREKYYGENAALIMGFMRQDD